MHAHRLAKLDTAIGKIDVAIDACRAGGVVDLDTVRALKSEREKLWREIQAIARETIA